jgi:hypothetical protein
MPDRDYVLEQYEMLREEALVPMAGKRGQGLSLFLLRGLPGWLTALTALGPPPRPRLHAREPGAARPQLPPAGRGALTTVLAEMVLACVQTTEGGR